MKLILIYILIFLTYSLLGQNEHEKYSDEFEYSCSTCHACKNPTKRNPCLISCPRFDLITIHHSAEEGPKDIIINFEYHGPDLYEEVVFSHKVHAEMSIISGGCAMCHHNNPPGKILACIHCHSIERKREEIDRPDLKGAYHRQCMDCHRKWEHKIECESCHVKHQNKDEVEKQSQRKKEQKRIHEKIEVPARIVFDTDTDEGSKVTFYHDEHINLFGFECTDCHSDESCVKCHDSSEGEVAEAAGDKIESEETHEFCTNCHDVEDEADCGLCHTNKIKAPFDHAKRSGFSLAKYHNKVVCKNCHGENKNFKNISKNCKSCHKNWSLENFNHKVTGISLDEDHIENDCEDCHKNNNYAVNPNCEDCHDEITYPDKLPGKRIK